MCQIHTITRTSWEKNINEWLEHLRDGALINYHGSALVLIDEDTGEHSVLRSKNWDDVEALLLANNHWTQAFIHQRYSTRGGTGLENVHFWQSNDVLYCHNGVFQGKEQAQFNVDSNIIGQYLEEQGIWGALGYMQSQEYANVFMIDLIDGVYYISRSVTNTLYTDNDGSFSTFPLDSVCEMPVVAGTIIRKEFNLTPAASYGITYNSPYKDDLDYEEQVRLSVLGDNNKE